MKKLSGHICDSCRVMFYPDEHVVEVCEHCYNTVWCVFNIYEDGIKELCSIHHTKEGAEDFINKGQALIASMNQHRLIKLEKQEISSWCVL